ncbi:MAG: sulfurtransferase [Phormidium tanganyikae FI6-MK23]|jgi:thiosulfate/3-mercaptopyruvate sulfurtransferase|nr:sulfurtransferase [Phormidium tanganyikae FI6-MK23]
MIRKLLRSRLKKPKILALLAAFLVSLVAIPLFSFSPLMATPSTAIQFVSPDWLAKNSSDRTLRVLDVRINPLEYFAGHLPNAIHIADNTFRGPNGLLPVQYWNTTKLGQLFSQAGVSNNSRVLVYSDARDILGATMVAYLLERSGVKEIAVLDGGFSGYKASGQPVTQEFPKYAPTRFTVQDNPAIRVTLADVRGFLNQPTVKFIDPRPPKLFSGEEKLWTRNGHIPGARNIPWVTFTQGNPTTSEGNFHKLKSLDEIKQILATKKITPADDVIVSCSTGREATLQYVVLKHLLGYPKVRIYEGSWTEYSQSDLPIETGAEKAA